MALIKCCKNCAKRYPACHDFCERYIAEKSESLEAHAKRMQFNQTEHDIVALKKRKKR